MVLAPEDGYCVLVVGAAGPANHRKSTKSEKLLNEANWPRAFSMGAATFDRTAKSRVAPMRVVLAGSALT